MEGLQHLSALVYLESLDDSKIFEIIKRLNEKRFKLNVLMKFGLGKKEDHVVIISYVLNSISKQNTTYGSNSFGFIAIDDRHIDIEWHNGKIRVFCQSVEVCTFDYTYDTEKFIDICFEILNHFK